jgi:hypothetical protein
MTLLAAYRPQLDSLRELAVIAVPSNGIEGPQRQTPLGHRGVCRSGHAG